MVSVISGNSPGLVNSSLNILGTKSGTKNSAGNGRSGEEVFVNAATGNLVLQRQDDLVLSRGQDIGTVRTYNSQGALGPNNWNIGLKRQLINLSTSTPNTGTNTRASSITRVDIDGSRLLYTYDSTRQAYICKEGSGSYDVLTFNAANNTWTLVDGDTRSSETYDWSGGVGKILAQTDADGNTSSFTYRGDLLISAKNASGETTSFEYRGALLTKVTELAKDGSTASRVRYDYDGYDRLVRVTVDLSPQDNSIADDKTYVTSYSYHDGLFTISRRIATITQSDGSRLAINYDGYDRVSSIIDALGNRTDFTYDSTNRKTTVNDPLGLITTYSYDAKGQLLAITDPAVGGVSSSRQFAYNANGDVTQITDGEGNRTVFSYDANGNLIAERDEAGNTIQRTYNANNQILSETRFLVPDPDGAGSATASGAQTTRYVYDAAGKNRLRFMISPEGRVTEYRYDSFGQRTAEINYSGAGYSGSGVLEADLNNFVSSSNKLQTRRTDFTYDFRGALASSTTYANVDSAGNGVKDGNQALTTYVYDAAGQLLKTIAPRAAQEVTTYSYDGMGRVLTRSNALRQLTTYQYDDAGNKTLSTAANGLVTIQSYDRAGRLLSQTETNAAAHGLGTSTYFYDANDQLRMSQDPSGVQTWYVYDNDGRKVGEIDGSGSLTEYVYNKNDQVSKTIRYAQAVNLSLLSVDGQGRPTSNALAQTIATLRPAASSGNQQTWFAYDKAGRLVKTVDASGAVTEQQYDGNSRLVKTIAYANRIATASLSNTPTAAGIAPTASADDRISRNLYDNDGLQTASIDGEGYLKEMLYNAAGQVWQTVQYATAIAPNLLAAINPGTQVASLRPAATAKDIRSYTWYDARGQVVGQVDGEGFLSEQRFDQNGNLVQSRRYAKAIPASSLAQIGANTSLAQVRPVANASLDQTRAYSYDELGRVTLAINEDGTKTSYSYDAAGNLLSKTDAVGTDEARTASKRYDLQGRVTRELSKVGAAQLAALPWPTNEQIEQIWTQYGTSYQYDQAGRLLSSTDPLGAQTLYFYNLDGALTYTINAMGEVQGSTYNALDQLIANTRYGTRLEQSVLSNLQATAAGGLLTNTIAQAVASALATISNPSADSTLRFGYGVDGKLASKTDELGNQTTLSYNAFGQLLSQTRAISPVSSVTEVLEYDKRGLQTAFTQDTTGIKARTSRQYDAFGREISAVDANGNQSQTSYDKLGRVVMVTDAVQASTRTTYDAFSRVTTTVDALGNKTSFSYNTAARSVTTTTPEGVQVSTTFNRFGQEQSVRDANGNITTFAYDANGDLLHTDSALAHTSQRYDAAGRLIESVDANGISTTLFYDAANRVLARHVDPNGLNFKTTYEYDAKGQIITSTDANGVSTVHEYDLKGQLLQQTLDPNGLNLRRQFSFDAQGNTLSVVDANQVRTQYVYDKLGRRIEQRVDPEGLNLLTRYTYDKHGNLSSKTDPQGARTQYVYDAQNRLAYTISALGSVQETVYDANGRVSANIAYAQRINPAALSAAPAMAEVKAALTPNAAQDQIERQFYDRDGRLSYRVNAVGAVSQYRYDGNGNQISSTEYANTIAAGASPASVVADAARDHSTRRVYDSLNRVIYSVDGAGAVTHFTYDANGNLLTSTAYANTISAGEAPQAVQVDAARDQVRSMQYDAANRLTTSTDAVGTATRYDYDANGNLLLKTVHGDELAGLNQVTRYEYDAANRLMGTISPLGTLTHLDLDGNGNVLTKTTYANALGDVNRVEKFSYDADNRLQYAVSALGLVRRHSYDANGNLLATTTYANLLPAGAAPHEVQASAADQTLRYQYDAEQRLIYSVDAGGAVTARSYDAKGNLLSQTAYATLIAANASADSVQASAHDQVLSHSYNAANQRVLSVNGVGAVTGYSYDAFGNVQTQTAYANLLPSRNPADLVADSSADQRLRYQYDAENRLTYSVNGVGAVTRREYDAFGNQIANTVYASLISPQAAPDSVNASAADRSTRTLYDQENRAIYHINGVGTVSQQRYNVFGEVIAKTVYAKQLGAGQGIESLQPSEQDQTARFVFDAEGRMRYAVNAKGAVAEYRYDTFGNLLAKTAYANLISAQDDPSLVTAGEQDRSQRYVYDAANRLRFAVDAMGGVSGMEYDSFGNTIATTLYANRIALDAEVQSVQADAQADRTLRAVFDANNRMSYSVDALGGVSRMEYDAFGNQSAKTVFATPLAAGQSIEQVQSSAQDHHTRAMFDAANRISYAVDETGAVTAYRYDASGNLLSQTAYAQTIAANAAPDSVAASSKDQTRRFAYDLDDKMVYAVDATGAVTAYAYDASGNQTGKTVYANRISATAAPDAVQASSQDQTSAATYDAANQLRYAVDGVGAVTGYERDAFGNIVAKTQYAKLLQKTAQGYDLAALQASAQDVRTRAQYDFNNQVSYAVDGTGAVSRYQRDTFGNIIASTDFATRIAFDQSADLVAVSAKDQHARFVFDANDRQIYAVNSLGVVSSNSYDVFGNLLAKTTYATPLAEGKEPGAVQADSARDQTQVYRYDLGNRLSYSVSSLGAVTHNNYDRFGNLVASTAYARLLAKGTEPATVQADPNDRLTRASYDAANRQIFSVDAMGAVQGMEYDAFGNLSRKTAYATALAANSAPETVLASAQDQVQRYAYDAANRLAFAVDAMGAVCQYEYDAGGNLSRKTAYATPVAANAAADSVQASARDHVSRMTYDAANRLRYSVDADGGVKQNEYDARGNLIRQTAYANKIGTQQAPQQVAGSARDQVQRHEYDALNQKIYSVDGAGAVSKFEYDVFGNLITRVRYAQTIAANQDPRSVAASTQDRVARFSYDSGNQLRYAVDALGAVSEYQYDSFGQMIANTAYATLLGGGAVENVQKSALDRSQRYQFDLGGRMIYEVAANGSVSQYGYDSFGNRTSATRFAKLINANQAPSQVQASPNQDVSTRAVFDKANRAIYSVNSLGAVEQYQYDVFGNQTGKIEYSALLPKTAHPSTVSSTEDDRITRAVYDANNRQRYAVDAMGGVTGFQYDAFGNLLAKTAYANTIARTLDPSQVQADPTRDQTTRAVFDGANRLVYSADAMGAVTRAEYDGTGNMIAKTEYATSISDSADLSTVVAHAADRLTRYEYDAAGRQVKTIYPQVEVFNAETNSSAVASLYTTAAYNAFGEIVANRDTRGNLRYQAYDVQGQVAASVDANGYVSAFNRDTFGNVLRQTRFANAISSSVRAQWGEQGASVTAILAQTNASDGQNRSIDNQYDVMGRLTQSTQTAVAVWHNGQLQNMSPTTRHSYDSLGRKISDSQLQSDGSWATTWHYFDALDRETATVDEAGYVTEQGFDTFGNVLRKTEFAQAANNISANGYTKGAASGKDREIRYVYDLNNRKLSDTHSNFEYSRLDANGQFADLSGEVTNRYEYDAFGNLIALTGTNLAVLRTYYDRANRTRAVVGAAHAIEGNANFAALTLFERDAFGNVLSQTEAAAGAANIGKLSFDSNLGGTDRVQRMRYDSWGRQIEVTDANGSSQYLSYDAGGKLAKQARYVSALNGSVRSAYTILKYDNVGQVTHALTPASDDVAVVDTQLQYNAFGEVVAKSVAGVSGGEYYEYDAGGRMWRSNGGDGVVKVMLYDLQGRQVADMRSPQHDFKACADLNAALQVANSANPADIRRTTQSYDVRGNVIRDTSSRGGIINRTYDRWNNLLSQSDIRDENWITRFTYNAANQVTSSTRPDSGQGLDITRTFYDISGNQIGVKDARGNLNRKTYDEVGNVTTEVHADGGVITHGYNAFNNEVSRVDALGYRSSFAYDKLGQMTQMKRQQSAGAAVDANMQITNFAYDQLGHKLYSQVEGVAGAITSYAYDLRGNVTQFNDKGSLTTFTYDALNRKRSERNAIGQTTTINNDYFGRVLSKTVSWNGQSNTRQYEYSRTGELSREYDNASGLNITYVYNVQGQQIERNDKVQGNSVRKTVYEYDLAGQHTLEQTSIDGTYYQNQSLEYDSKGQLVRVVSHQDGGKTLSYTYDVVGNRIAQSEDIGGPTVESKTFSFDSMNRQVEAGGIVLEYDKNGNRTKEVAAGKTNLYTYDGLGNLTSSNDGSTTTTRSYDKLGRVVEASGQFKNTYDSYGRLTSQVLTDTRDGKTETTNVTNNYDGIGNLTSSQRKTGDEPTASYQYHYTLIGDSLKQTRVTGNLGNGDTGSTNFAYDLSGNLTALTDSKKDSNNRSFINDANGIALVKNQNPNQMRNFVVNGLVLGTYGSDLNPEKPETKEDYTIVAGDTLQSIADKHKLGSWTWIYKEGLKVKVQVEEGTGDDKKMVWRVYDIQTLSGNDANGADKRSTALLVGNNDSQVPPVTQTIAIYKTDKPVQIRDFVQYQAIDQSHPGADSNHYTVAEGDTLRSIAQKVYGDSGLWYVLADANGLQNDQDLHAGQSIVTPSRVAGTHNTADTFKPYEPGKITGDTSPFLPPPPAGGSHCAMIGIIIAAVVAAVIITIVTAGAASAALAAAGGAIAGMSATMSAIVVGAAAGAVGGALGSAASQGILIAGGIQKEFSWKDVGIGALTGFISGGAMAGIGALGQGGAAGAKAAAEGAKTIASASRSAVIAARAGEMAGRAAAYAAVSVVNDAISQGIDIAADSSVQFSWKRLAGAAVSGAFSGALSRVGNTAMQELIGATVGDISGSALSNVIMNNGGFDPTQFAIDTAGNIAGGAIGYHAGKIGQRIGQKYAARANRGGSEIEMMPLRSSVSTEAEGGSKYDKHIILQLGDSSEAATAAANLRNKNGGIVQRWTPGTALDIDASGNTRVQIVGHDTDYEAVGGAQLAKHLGEDLGLTAPLAKVRLVGCNQDGTAAQFAAASEGIANKVSARAAKEWVTEDGRKHVVTEEGYSLAKGAQKVSYARDADGGMQQSRKMLSADELASHGQMREVGDGRIRSLGEEEDLAEIESRRKIALESELRQLSDMALVKKSAGSLAKHVETLVAERAELNKWNLNGSGRNQGLTHIVDYAYARPAKTKDKNLLALMAHSTVSGKKLVVSLNTLDAAENPLSKGFDSMIKKEGLMVISTLESRQAQSELAEVKLQMADMMKKSSDKRVTANSEGFLTLKSKSTNLENEVFEKQYYTLATDDSKAGRIKLVENSAGLKAGEFKSTLGSEIVGVTREMDRLAAHSSTTATATLPKGGTINIDGWVKVGVDGKGHAKWGVGTQTVANTAVSTTLKTESNGTRLRIEKWGTTSLMQNYSTVMGD